MGLFGDNNIIAVQVGSHSLKVVKLKSGAGTPVLAAAFSTKIPEDVRENAGIAAFIKDALKAHKVQGSIAATTISGHELISRQLSLPVMPEKDLREAVIWEMRKETGIPAEELVTDYMVSSGAATDDNKISVAAFATRSDESLTLISMFKEAGLDLRLLSVEPAALLTVFDHNNKWEKDVNYAILAIGDQSSTLVIAKEHKVLFTREITFGGDDITRSIAAGLHVDSTEAEEYKIRWGLDVPSEDAETVGTAMRSLIERLCIEIHRSIDYFQAQFRGGAVPSLYLAGGSSLLNGIDDFISETIGIACFSHDPFKKIKIPASMDKEAVLALGPSLNIATGLALSRY